MKNIFKRKGKKTEDQEETEMKIDDVTLSVEDLSTFEYKAQEVQEEKKPEKKPRKRKTRSKKKEEEKKEETPEEKPELKKLKSDEEVKKTLEKDFKVQPPRSLRSILKEKPVERIVETKKEEQPKFLGSIIKKLKKINANDLIKFSIDLERQSKDVFEVIFDNDTRDDFKISIKVNKKKKTLEVSEFTDGKWNRVTRISFNPKDLKNKIEVAIKPLQTKIPLIITNLTKLEINRVNKKVAINEMIYEGIEDLFFN